MAAQVHPLSQEGLSNDRLRYSPGVDTGAKAWAAPSSISSVQFVASISSDEKKSRFSKSAEEQTLAEQVNTFNESNLVFETPKSKQFVVQWVQVTDLKGSPGLVSKDDEKVPVFNNFYDHLGPQYRPFTEEEACVVSLGADIRSRRLKVWSGHQGIKRKLAERNTASVEHYPSCRLKRRRLDENDTLELSSPNVEKRSPKARKCTEGTTSGDDEEFYPSHQPHIFRDDGFPSRSSYKRSNSNWETTSWRVFGRRFQDLQRRLWPIGRPQSVFVSTDELRATLRCWHASLKLDNLSSCTIALHMYRRRVRTLESSLYLVRGLNVTVLLAVSLWVAVKLVDSIAKVPKASSMAEIAGIPVKLMMYQELPFLDALHWNLLRF